jgi:aminoglycoside N3'-acetyltransferase
LLKNFNTIKNTLNNFKVQNYKFIYIYSDFRYFFTIFKKDPIKFIDNFINYLLDLNLTIVVPTFSYTTKGIFDVSKTKTNLGFFNKYILKNRKSFRSEHPIFSFAAIGKNKNIVLNVPKNAFGPNSVHDRLFKNNACFLNIGRSLTEGNTLIHQIEKINNCSYRFEKEFKTKVYKKEKYIGTNYSAFLRKNIHTKMSFDKIYKIVKKKKFFLHCGNDREFSNINLYSYDSFYYCLDINFKKNKKIFLK